MRVLPAKYNVPYVSKPSAVTGGPLQIEYVGEDAISQTNTWVANELAEANRLKKIELRIKAMEISKLPGLTEVQTDFLAELTEEINNGDIT